MEKMKKIEKIEKIEKMEVKLNLLDICDDQSYYIIDSDTKSRTYVLCPSCGFIPISKIDDNTKFIDLHCKCGSFAIFEVFTIEEIMEMVDSVKEAQKYANMIK